MLLQTLNPGWRYCGSESDDGSASLLQCPTTQLAPVADTVRAFWQADYNLSLVEYELVSVMGAGSSNPGPIPTEAEA